MNIITLILFCLLIVSLITILILTIFYIKCKNNENYSSIDLEHQNVCGTCQGLGNKVCTNKELLHKLYNDGTWTENSLMINNGHNSNI